MTRPLRSTPITGASPLLPAGPPAGPATVLTPTPRASYSLSPAQETQTRSTGPGLLPFHAEAADRARVAFMPDTTWPISGHPPGSSRDCLHTPVSMPPVSVSTRPQRFARARLPDPHLTHPACLFHIAHHSRVTAPAACGGLKPPPAGRLRRASNPSSPAQHRFEKLYLHRTPSHVRDTRRHRNARTRHRKCDSLSARRVNRPQSGPCRWPAITSHPGLPGALDLVVAENSPLAFGR
jgi:hypothetical protein